MQNGVPCEVAIRLFRSFRHCTMTSLTPSCSRVIVSCHTVGHSPEDYDTFLDSTRGRNIVPKIDKLCDDHKATNVDCSSTGLGLG